MRGLREELLADATGDVLEVGCGTGRNLPFYHHAQSLVLTEPDPEMARRTRRHLGGAAMPVELVEAPAEALPFASGRFQTAVSTLVLCTVRDPAVAIAEIRRVLEPGGLFLVMEHTQAHPGGWRRAQDLFAPAWRHLAAGCHLNRPTLAMIEAAGFLPVQVAEVGQGLLPLRVGRYRSPGQAPQRPPW